MESDAEDTKTLSPSSTPTHEHNKKKRKKNKAPSLEATIQVFPENPEKTPPVVAYVPSRFDPTNPQHANSTQVGFFRNSKANRSRSFQLVATPGGSNIDFVGTSYTGEATIGQHCNYGLGILDKATQTLKIVPIVANKVFRLEPRVRGVDHDKKPASLVMGEITKQEKEDKDMELQMLYGTKKAIRANKKLRLLKQDDDPDSLKDLDAKIKEIVANREALEGTERQSSRNIPPFNASATTPQEAYPLDKIIRTGEWDSLQNIYDLLQGGTEVSWDAFPNFVCNRIEKLKNIQVEDEKFKLSCIFSYITHLIKFKDQNSGYPKDHRFPNILHNKFLTMFPPRSHRLSKEKTNLLISYVLVLTLFADEFHTDLTDIAKDLRIHPPDLRKHYEYLGCKVSAEKKLMFATLPVPLNFREAQKKRQKRNK